MECVKVERMNTEERKEERGDKKIQKNIIYEKFSSMKGEIEEMLYMAGRRHYEREAGRVSPYI